MLEGAFMSLVFVLIALFGVVIPLVMLYAHFMVSEQPQREAFISYVVWIAVGLGLLFKVYFSSVGG